MKSSSPLLVHTNLGCLIAVVTGVAGVFHKPLLPIAAICLIISLVVSLVITWQRSEAGELPREQVGTMMVGYLVLLGGAGWLLVYSFHRL